MKPALKIVAYSEFKIEKGIQIPTATRGDVIYPFADMLKGDSFLVPLASPTDYHRVANRIGKQKQTFMKRFGGDYRFTIRTVDGGIRCWRVK